MLLVIELLHGFFFYNRAYSLGKPKANSAVLYNKFSHKRRNDSLSSKVSHSEMRWMNDSLGFICIPTMCKHMDINAVHTVFSSRYKNFMEDVSFSMSLFYKWPSKCRSEVLNYQLIVKIFFLCVCVSFCLFLGPSRGIWRFTG